MAIVFKEYVTTGTECVAAVKQGILASSDWAHLQLTTGTQATTLSSAASAGAVSISTAATIPSGSYIVIGNGAANPEVRITAGVSGSGPYTVTFTKALEASYSSSAAVGVGSIVKATTTRGAQMVLDLADAAVSTTQLSMALYRTHNGTTGVDKTLRYLLLNISALTNTCRVTVSASKEHLFFWVEGPRMGETGVDTGYGPARRWAFMGDVTPYFVGDTVPAVVAVMSDASNDPLSGRKAYVSRNQADSDSWVPAGLLTMSVPAVMTTDMDGSFYSSWQQVAKGDGKVYIFPYIIMEDKDGMRGRITSALFAGWSQNTGQNPSGFGIIPWVLTENAFVSYGGMTYRVVRPMGAANAYTGGMAMSFTAAYRSNDFSILLAVPYSVP